MPGPVLELGDTASYKAQSELAERSGDSSHDSGYNSKILVLCCKQVLWSNSCSPHSNPMRPHFTELGKPRQGDPGLSDLPKDASPVSGRPGCCDDVVTTIPS